MRGVLNDLLSVVYGHFVYLFNVGLYKDCLEWPRSLCCLVEMCRYVETTDCEERLAMRHHCG